MTKREDQLEARIQQLEEQITQLTGVRPPEPSDPTQRPDYIEPGSPDHARFIGLMLLDDAEEADGRIVYTSRPTGQLYCLEDERAALAHCPGMSREDAVHTVLREKVSAFESGPPEVPDWAPDMWRPERLMA